MENVEQDTYSPRLSAFGSLTSAPRVLAANFRDFAQTGKLPVAEHESQDTDAINWRTVIDTCLEGVWIVDREGRTTFANQRMADMLGYAVSEMTGRSMYDFMDEAVKQEAARNMRRRRRGVSEHHEFRLKRKDGSDLWTIMAASPRFDAAGQFTGALAMVTDVSERRRTEDDLRGSKALYQSIVGILHEGIVFQDADGNIIACNAAAEKILDLRAEDMIGRTSSDPRWQAIREDGSPFPGDQHPAMVTLRTGRPCSDVLMGLKKADGAVTWIEINSQPMSPVGSAGTGVVTSFTDVTARKAAQDALKQSEHRFRTLATFAPVGIFLADALGSLVYMNNWYAEHTGYTIEQILDNKWWAYVHPEDRAATEDAYFSAVRSRRRHDSEFRGFSRDGRMVWFHGTIAPLDADGGSDAGFIGITMDITARKLAEAQLFERDQRLRTLAANIPGIVYQRVLHPDGTTSYPYISPAVSEIYGYSAEEIMADPSLFAAAVHPDSRAGFDSSLARSAATMGAWEWEGVVNPRQGGVKWIQIRGRPRHVDTGGIVWDGIILDVTKAKETEAQLLQVQRLDAVGMLTGGIAHDFNNIFTVILANSEGLLSGQTLNERDKQAAELIHAATERGASLTRQMLAFSRRQILQPVVVDLNPLVERMVQLLRRTLGDGIAIRTEFTADLWPTYADVTQLESAILNLGINARDAMANGGTLSIQTSKLLIEPEQARPGRVERPGEYVCLTISDTGAGMPPHVLERAVEPFFTTKGLGKGTGLGLSMVHGFVNQSGGFMKIASEPGRGTSISLCLPRHRSA